MKIGYKPLWKTLIDKNMSKRDLRLQAHLTINHIANMGKGQHVSLATIVKISETLQCDLTDVIALANTMYLDTSYLHLGTSHIVMSSFSIADCKYCCPYRIIAYP